MKIVASAVIYNGVLYTGPRHHHCLVKAYNANMSGPVRGELQGFVLEDGTYIDRLEGARIALREGQIPKLNWPPNLFSEDLWPGVLVQEDWPGEDLNPKYNRQIDEEE